MLLLAAIAVAAPSASSAQPPAQAFDELTTRVRAGDIVWVAGDTGREVKGRVIDLTPHTLTIASGDGRINFSLDDVARVRKKRPDSKWNGAAIGAGLALAVPLWYCSQAYESGETCGEGVKALMVIGAIGAGIGAAVDANASRRAIVYERGRRMSLAGTTIPSATGLPAGRIAFSYAALKEGSVLPTFGLGWVAAISARVTPSWEIAAEVGRSAAEQVADRTLVRTRWHVTTVAIGPRWVKQPRPRLRVFVQTLVGEARLTGTRISCGIFTGTACDAGVGDTGVTPRLVVEPGAGLDIALWRRLEVRVEGDRRVLIGGGGFAAGTRLVAGLVVGL